MTMRTHITTESLLFFTGGFIDNCSCSEQGIMDEKCKMRSDVALQCRKVSI